MFYAAHARYGTRTAYGPCHRPAIYVFPTKRERDAWVSADVWDGDFHREPMAARDARKWIRKGCEPHTGENL